MDLQLYNIVKEGRTEYGEKLVKFANKYFDKFKEIVNNNHFKDNELMWVFMFLVNRYAEQFPANGKEDLINLKYTHTDTKGSWEFYMVEEHNEFTGYGISENWFGNKNIGFRGIAFPCSWLLNDGIFSTINNDKCVNGTGDRDGFEIEYIEYIIKNSNVKYSEVDANNKYMVDHLIKENYVYIENDDIKFNFVMFTKEQYNLIETYFKYHTDLDEIKLIRDSIFNKLCNYVKDVVQSNLICSMHCSITGFLMLGLREGCINSFYKAGLIKENDNGNSNRFNFNMFAYKFID